MSARYNLSTVLKCSDSIAGLPAHKCKCVNSKLRASGPVQESLESAQPEHCPSPTVTLDQLFFGMLAIISGLFCAAAHAHRQVRLCRTYRSQPQELVMRLVQDSRHPRYMAKPLQMAAFKAAEVGC